jgi:hypothetical protein
MFYDKIVNKWTEIKIKKNMIISASLIPFSMRFVISVLWETWIPVCHIILYCKKIALNKSNTHLISDITSFSCSPSWYYQILSIQFSGLVSTQWKTDWFYRICNTIRTFILKLQADLWLAFLLQWVRKINFKKFQLCDDYTDISVGCCEVAIRMQL